MFARRMADRQIPVDRWGRHFCLLRADRNACPTPRPVCVGVVLCLGWAIAAVCFIGCRGDRGPERVIVSGTVTYNGKPIGEGEIRFMPVAASVVPMAAAEINDSKYRVDLRGGVPVGTHKIEIEAVRVDKSRLKPGQPMPPSARLRGVPFQQYIPKRYNLDSELQITIEPGCREITKDFDLKD
jgi:hypothetical protein